MKIEIKDMPGAFYGSDLFDSAEENAVIEVMRSQTLFRYYGRNLLHKTDYFEKLICKYMKSAYCLAVSSGTAALKCALKALEIGPGDEVIVPAYGFIATAGAVINVGAKPIFADVDSTLTIDLNDIKRKVTPMTKAIVVVHLFGASGDMEKMRQYANEQGLFIVEDVAQAFGGEYNGKKLGTFGDIGCFSFQANKILCTGEGGAIITNNQYYYKKAKMYHDQGGLRIGSAFPTWNDSDCFIGENLRMSEIHSAIGIEQLKKIPMMLEVLKKRKLLLKNMLIKEGLKLKFREVVSQGECYSTTIILVDDSKLRDLIKEKMEENSIVVSKYYGTSVYECGLFGQVDNCENSDTFSRQVLGFPTILKMDDETYEQYIRKIVLVFKDILK